MFQLKREGYRKTEVKKVPKSLDRMLKVMGPDTAKLVMQKRDSVERAGEFAAEMVKYRNTVKVALKDTFGVYVTLFFNHFNRNCAIATSLTPPFE